MTKKGDINTCKIISCININAQISSINFKITIKAVFYQLIYFWDFIKLMPALFTFYFMYVFID